MTAITDATLIIETIIGRTMTAEELINIADSFVARNVYSLAGWQIVITEPTAEYPDEAGPFPYNVDRDPTNEEKAQLFMDTLKLYGHETIRFVVGVDKAAELQPQIEAAQDAALLDMT